MAVFHFQNKAFQLQKERENLKQQLSPEHVSEKRSPMRVHSAAINYAVMHTISLQRTGCAIFGFSFMRMRLD